MQSILVLFKISFLYVQEKWSGSNKSDWKFKNEGEIIINLI